MKCREERLKLAGGGRKVWDSPKIERRSRSDRRRKGATQKRRGERNREKDKKVGKKRQDSGEPEEEGTSSADWGCRRTSSKVSKDSRELQSESKQKGRKEEDGKRRAGAAAMEEDIRKQGPLYLQQQRFGKVKTHNTDLLPSQHEQ